MWKISQQTRATLQSTARLKALQSWGISPLIADILEKRGHVSRASMLDFLRPSLFDLPSPFLFKDMEKVIKRLEVAREAQQKILIYGDYDADGVTGTALIYQALYDLGFSVIVHIPSRQEGYGLQREVIEKAFNNDVKLIITVDCGITALEESIYAIEQGIDLIITDHHEPPERLPLALGIINPKVKDSGYPFTQLAGVGVAFKLIQALFRSLGYPVHPSLTEVEYLDLVALGTIADLVPLVGENRIFVRYGLEVMEKTRHIGVKAILAECGLSGKKLKAGQIAFIIAPRINAAGRMDTARLALNLLLSKDEEDALTIAKALSSENYQRQLTEKEILTEAENMILSEPLPKVIVLSSPSWHHGVIGIVASRLVERLQRPVFLIAEEGEIGKGSARGIPDYHVLDELQKQASLLSKYGGHKQAAGFTLPGVNIQSLREGLKHSVSDRELDFGPQYRIDAIINWKDIALDLQQELELMAPCGIGNPAPVLMSQALTINRVISMGKNAEHLKLILAAEGKKHEAIAFNRGKEFEQLKNMGIIDIIYCLEINNYQGAEKVQAVMKDYRLSSDSISEIACSQESGYTITEECVNSSQAAIDREMLVDFYRRIKELARENEIISWNLEPNDLALQLNMLKIFEELGLIRWAGGTNPYIFLFNKASKTHLENSLRFRILS